MEEFSSIQVGVAAFRSTMSDLDRVARSEPKAHIEVLGELPTVTTALRKREYFGITPPSKKLENVVTNLTSFLDFNRALIETDHKEIIARLYGRFPELGSAQELRRLFRPTAVVKGLPEGNEKLAEVTINGKIVTCENYAKLREGAEDRGEFKIAVRKELETLLEEGGDVETLKFVEVVNKLGKYTEDYFPYFHNAIIEGQSEMFDYLMTKGKGKLDGSFGKGQSRRTPIEQALLEGRWGMVQKMVDAEFYTGIRHKVQTELAKGEPTRQLMGLLLRISSALDKNEPLESLLKEFPKNAAVLVQDIAGAEIVLARLHGRLSLDQELFKGLDEGVKALF